ncbi:hypothetical protein BC829DRAFT_405834, partial [Chytridium lagenaria]
MDTCLMEANVVEAQRLALLLMLALMGAWGNRILISVLEDALQVPSLVALELFAARASRPAISLDLPWSLVINLASQKIRKGSLYFLRTFVFPNMCFHSRQSFSANPSLLT